MNESSYGDTRQHSGPNTGRRGTAERNEARRSRTKRVSRSKSGGGHILSPDLLPDGSPEKKHDAVGLVAPLGGGDARPLYSSEVAAGGSARRDSEDASDSDSVARHSQHKVVGFANDQAAKPCPPELPAAGNPAEGSRGEAGSGGSVGDKIGAGVAKSPAQQDARASQSSECNAGEGVGIASSTAAAVSSACRMMGPGAAEQFSWEEVRKHRYSDSCWLVARGVVYDVTSFLDEHPVGADAILRRAGRDNTEDLDFHSRGAQAMWNKYRIGVIEGQAGGCVVA